jgi:hypothetical protein
MVEWGREETKDVVNCRGTKGKGFDDGEDISRNNVYAR